MIELSIIIPAYNVENYISDTLSSCLEQDIPSENYEIICVDDGSTDKTGQILDEFSNSHSNIVVLHQDNHGVSFSRNVGLQRAGGVFVWFVDGDDCIRRNCLSNLMNFAKDFDMLFLQDTMFDENIHWDELKEYPEKKKELINFECIAFRLFRRQVINERRIEFDTSLTHGEDNIFVYTFEKYALRKKIYPVVIYYYRRRMNSATRSRGKNKLSLYESQIKQAVFYHNELENYSDRNGFSRREIEKFENIFTKRALVNMILYEKSFKAVIKHRRILRSTKILPLKFSEEHPTGKVFKEKTYNIVTDLSVNTLIFWLLWMVLLPRKLMTR